MTNYREATTSFVNSAKGVVGAVDMLKAAIAGGDPEDIKFTTELVTGAADNYLGNTETYQRRGLDEIATPQPRPSLNRKEWRPIFWLAHSWTSTSETQS